MMELIVKQVWFLFIYLFNSFQIGLYWPKQYSQIAIQCSYIGNEGNAKWNETLAIGQIVNGTCLSGYNGSVSRNCTKSGSNGNWGSITGTCNGIPFLFCLRFSFFFLSSFLFSFPLSLLSFNSDWEQVIETNQINKWNSCLLFG